MSTDSKKQNKKERLRRLLSQPFLRSRLPCLPEEPAAMPPTIAPDAADLLEQVQETIARIQKANPQTITNANKATIRDRIDDADLLALEKKDLDAKVAALKASNVYQADYLKLGSRWSPNSTETELSTRAPIEDVPSDEEPEICEADVAIVYPVKKIPAGTVKLVGTGAPALNRRQREEEARPQTKNVVSFQGIRASKAADKDAFEKTLHRKRSSDDLRRGKAHLAHKKSTGPLPAYLDYFEEEERKKILDIPRDAPSTSPRARGTQHGDVNECPQSSACTQDFTAERAIPPVSLQQSALSTTRLPPKSPKRAPPIAPMMPLRTPPPPPIPIKSAYRPSGVPSSTAVPLPTSPVPPFCIAPVRGKPLSPSTRSPLSQATMTASPSTIQRNAPPRIQLPVPGPNAALPRSSSLQAPMRQECDEGQHTFRPINLNAARMASAYHCTGSTENTDGPACCEKCGREVEVCMQCEVPVCSLAACYDCANIMKEEA
ncbi:uncharacterized protein CC84DRAFT_1256842 [Paraphaeosphaeria sporulosa]|uniref:Uncharacterized protein n=1 Tax=Paraphaeosphaeria sporulosa TaxID=1460663 RepID=A0A177CKP9_9PLEO|nr:uncharacterized protein CC84DRAFT_1256842 [Paraphaeosphaeria sporulosa]OAG07876.1 hypothetical protein CC84DRAFT_1256842 [Paraphaeosphaeria sporulosa]